MARSTGSVAAWFNALPDAWQAPAQRLRELLMDASPVMKEEWKYNTPFYSNGRWMCYLSLQKKGLVLGFVEGIHLLDPEGLFANTDHAQIRHFLPQPAPARMNERAVQRLIDEAVAYNVERLALRMSKRRT